MTRVRSLVVAGAGLILSLAVAACSGSSDASAPAGSIAGGGTTLDLSQSAAQISSLKSFRFSLNASIDLGSLAAAGTEDALGSLGALLLGDLSDIEVKGAFVAPDQVEVSMSLGSEDFGFVQIGDRAWVRYGGAWMEVDAEELGLPAGSLDFGDLTANVLPAEILQAARVTSEKVNGLSTTRYSFDKAALEGLAASLGPMPGLERASVDVWVTDDGIPVKMTVDLRGKDEGGEEVSVRLELLVTDLNGDIKIKAPM